MGSRATPFPTYDGALFEAIDAILGRDLPFTTEDVIDTPPASITRPTSSRPRLAISAAGESVKAHRC